MRRFLPLLILGLVATVSRAQQAGYMQNNLVANTAGVAAHTDSQLSNPWGIALLPDQPFWIANNNGGTSTLYDSSGNKNSLVVQLPSASTNPCSPACPTGIVANTNGADFGGAQFIFDSEDGILAAWSQGAAATRVVDNSASGAVYKGLALLSNGSGNFLLAANFNSGKIDVFDRSFNPATLSGSFSDPKLPAGLAPHGIHIVNDQIFVAYGLQDAQKHDPVVGAGNGVVDIFDTNGKFVHRFATGGVLNAPWGVALSSANFGQFSNAILVGNFGDGTINAFDANGNSLGQLTDTSGKAIVNPGLWELLFGQLVNDPDTLYLTAGGASQTQGLFATLKAAQAATTGNFSLSVSATSSTVNVGSATNINVSVSSIGGFNSAVTLSCSGLPVGVTCSFSPDSITPGTSSVTSVLMVSVAQSFNPTMPIYNPASLWMPLSGSGFGFFGLPFAAPSETAKKKLLKRVAVGFIALLVLVLLSMAAGCSNYAGSHMSGATTGGAVMNVVVTGTSGSISHSAQIALTIN